MQLEKPDYVELLQIIAESVKTRLNEKHLVLHSSQGQGYVWAEKLPCGITVMVSDTAMVADISFTRIESEPQFYSLQFNEEAEHEDVDISKRDRRNLQELQSFAKLTHTLVPETFTFPKGKRVRSVKFFFNKGHLVNLLGKEAVENVLSQYFPLLIKNNSLEPIATEYRVMLNELIVEKVNQPLRLNFIQNRVLMLLEKFILKLHANRDLQGNKVKRSDDETVRLMKVEALLVKNFAVSPPTIDELSRISAMSPTKLKNDFKMLYGLPIYEYYQKNRMLKAKSLLMLGKYSIKEVGMMVGYSNLSHFAHTFKKEFGFLPSELSARDGVLVYNT
jgi:AraC-like DNA-binding protein